MQVHENEDVIQWHYSTIQHIQSHLYEYFVDWILLLLHMMGGITAIAWEKEYQIFRFHWNQCQKVIATIKVTTFSFFFVFWRVIIHIYFCLGRQASQTTPFSLEFCFVSIRVWFLLLSSIDEQDSSDDFAWSTKTTTTTTKVLAYISFDICINCLLTKFAYNTNREGKIRGQCR